MSKNETTVRRYLALVVLAIALTPISSFAVGNGGDGGSGENSVAGHPLEYWKKDISTLPEFQQRVKPALDRLAKELPGLARKLSGYVTSKNWYFVPVPLRTLPSSVVGVAFGTSQDALQTQGAVWITTGMYNGSGRTIQDKAIDLMHELVMGDEIGMLVDNVRGGGVDYDEVRTLTTRILGLNASDNSLDLQSFVQAQGFGFYTLAMPSGFSGTMSMSEFISYWNGQLQMGAIPVSNPQFEDKDCVSVVKPAADNKSFMFTIDGGNLGAGTKFQATTNIDQISSPIMHSTYAEYDFQESITGQPVGQSKNLIKILVGSNMKIISIEADKADYVFDISTHNYKWVTTQLGVCGTRAEWADGPYYFVPYVQ